MRRATRRRWGLAAVLGACLLAGLAAPPDVAVAGPSLAALGPDGELAFETSPFMRRYAYAHPERTATELTASGAYSPLNQRWEQSGRSGSWRIEEQRYGAEAVAAGIAGNDPQAIDRGLRILEWGFAQQQPDGGFACDDAFHSTSFFVEAAARSILLLDRSRYAASVATRTAAMKSRLLAAAHWMIAPANLVRGSHANEPYTHRRYLVAAALGLAALIVPDEPVRAVASRFVREGIALQWPDGVNPEKGGHDSSYQAVGLFFALRYYSLAATDAERRALWPMLERGIRWERGRVGTDGSVNAEGNTRTGLGQERGPNGTLKDVSYGTVFRLFYRWSQVAADSDYAVLAEQVAAARKRH